MLLSDDDPSRTQTLPAGARKESQDAAIVAFFAIEPRVVPSTDPGGA